MPYSGWRVITVRKETKEKFDDLRSTGTTEDDALNYLIDYMDRVNRTLLELLARWMFDFQQDDRKDHPLQ